jgi:hypothetical protein
MQRIEFSSPLANAQNYPAALFKVEPQQPLFGLSLFARQHLQQLDLQFFRSGRGALYFAAEQLKKPGDNVILLPAYHCPALVEPFIAAGYQIEFYPLQADLTVDLAALQLLITPKTTHCLLVRYFGNAAQVSAQLAWLSEQGLITFDDCAHDLQSFLRPELIADATICSIKKFIASSDGGALRLKQTNVAALSAVPLQAELKNLLRTLLAGWQQHRVPQQRLLPMPAADAVPINERAANHPDSRPLQADKPLFRYFQPKDKQQQCYWLTQWLFYHTDVQKLLQLRQQHCKQLMTGLAQSALGRLLWQEVPENCAPYVIPFLLNHSSSFDLLRKRGLQIYRWEELAPSNCDVSQDYRHRLIQIPCHQDLSAADIEQIIQAFC